MLTGRVDEMTYTVTAQLWEHCQELHIDWIRVTAITVQIDQCILARSSPPGRELRRHRPRGP